MLSASASRLHNYIYTELLYNPGLLKEREGSQVTAMSGTAAHVQTPANGRDSENQSDVITQCRSSAYLCDTIQSVPVEPLDYYECKRFKEKPLRKCHDLE